MNQRNQKNNEEEDEDNDYNYYDAAEDMEESDEFDTQYQEIRKRMNELYETQKTDLFNDIANTNAAKKNANNLDRVEALSTEPDSQRSYKYNGLKMLIKKDVGQYIQNSGYTQGNIYICAYQVNTTGQLPFLQFVMTRSQENKMNLPNFNYNDTPNILEMCRCTLDIILTPSTVVSGVPSLTSAFGFGSLQTTGTSMSVPQHKYQGFAQDGNNFYVFFDFSQYNIESQHFLLQDEVYLVLIDEFINHKQIGKYAIDKTAIDFFSINPELLYLTDINNNNNNYETPAVLYSGNIGKMIDFTYIFGVSKSTSEYLHDPHYYFTNYANAIEQSNELKKKYDNEYPGSFTTRGVIRFAVFLGSMEIYSNPSTVVSGFQPLTHGSLQSDHFKTDSITDFQSIYLKNDTHSYWIVKNYEQQTSLSTHNI